MRRPPRAKIPERCDPADPTPVESFVENAPTLSIDERIRLAVQTALAPAEPSSAEPSEDELLALAEVAGEDHEPLTELQVREMAPEAVDGPDIPSFLETLSDVEKAELRSMLAPLEPGPDEGGAPSEPAA